MNKGTGHSEAKRAEKAARQTQGPHSGQTGARNKETRQGIITMRRGARRATPRPATKHKARRERRRMKKGEDHTGPEGPRGGKQQRCKGHPTGRSHWTCHFYQFGPQFVLFMREGRWQCRGKTSVDSWLHYFQTNPQPQIVIKYRYNLNRL